MEQQQKGARLAWVFGGGGLVGAQLIDVLIEAPDYSRIYSITRRPSLRASPKVLNRIVRFDELEVQLAGVPVHDAFCCVGTTMARAGSEAEFRAVDFDTTLRIARVSSKAGAQRFIVVSAVGASPTARSFYLRMKGELEQALAALKFEALHILQPGLLLGSRSENRPVEAALRMLMPVVNPLLLGQMRAYRGIAARTVAAAMLGAARSGRRGLHRYTYDAILKAAASKPPAASRP
jgi:uncharacterized protein YbjT (DUF2867 family)